VGGLASAEMDGSRAKERKVLGTEMIMLGHELRSYGGQHYGLFMHQIRPKIDSCFATAKNFGIWVPDDQIFSINPAHAMDLIVDYLIDVGRMLQDEHFSEAKQHVKSREAVFDLAE